MPSLDRLLKHPGPERAPSHDGAKHATDNRGEAHRQGSPKATRTKAFIAGAPPARAVRRRARQAGPTIYRHSENDLRPRREIGSECKNALQRTRRRRSERLHGARAHGFDMPSSSAGGHPTVAPSTAAPPAWRAPASVHASRRSPPVPAARTGLGAVRLVPRRGLLSIRLRADGHILARRHRHGSSHQTGHAGHQHVSGQRAAATPTSKLAADTTPSFAQTAARSQPMRSVRCRSA